MGTQEKAKLAVIGIGVMGREHVKDVVALPQTELVAMCDIDRERAEETAVAYQVQLTPITTIYSKTLPLTASSSPPPIMSIPPPPSPPSKKEFMS